MGARAARSAHARLLFQLGTAGATVILRWHGKVPRGRPRWRGDHGIMCMTEMRRGFCHTPLHIGFGYANLPYLFHIDFMPAFIPASMPRVAPSRCLGRGALLHSDGSSRGVARGVRYAVAKCRCGHGAALVVWLRLASRSRHIFYGGRLTQNSSYST